MALKILQLRDIEKIQNLTVILFSNLVRKDSNFKNPLKFKFQKSVKIQISKIR
jgi:hypothetical protein